MSDRSETAREIGRIVAALDTLLAAIEARSIATPSRASRIAVFSVADLARRSPIESMLDDPVGRALRLGIRRLGERLDQLGGFPLMQDITERVADMSPRHAGRRLSILDFAFDGVGRWVA